uniref:Alkylglycerone-phosphate synthase n=1 Tax=Macrostomum lignano TaxID=282301 RepID=A0A1I8FJ94_9PLAT
MPDDSKSDEKPSGSDKETAKDSVFKTATSSAASEMPRASGMDGEGTAGASIDQRSPAKFTRRENIPPPVQVNADFMSAIPATGLSHSDAGRTACSAGTGTPWRRCSPCGRACFPACRTWLSGPLAIGRWSNWSTWPTAAACADPIRRRHLRHRRPAVPVRRAPHDSLAGHLADESDLWLDERNLIGRFEAGIIGQDLEARLAELGYCIGHEPDSLEFSTWAAGWPLGASGMRRTSTANIEDLLVHLRAAPRREPRPDVHHLIMGSEGSLGVVTEVTLKIRRCRADQTLRIAWCLPTSPRGVRLPPRVGAPPLRPGLLPVRATPCAAASGWTTAFVDAVKRFYVTRVRGFKPDELAVATLLYEGTPEERSPSSEALVNSIAANHGGISGGEENGRRGYMLTFVIAYLRDLGLDYYCVGESFETSCHGTGCWTSAANVKLRIKEECRSRGVTQPCCPPVSACVYFYFAYNYRGLPDPCTSTRRWRNAARDEILANGGSLSHHHGVGKIRQRWYSRSVSEPAVAAGSGGQIRLDPNNVFACGNLFEPAGGPDGQTEQKAKL